MKSKALILTVLTAIALQAPTYACGKKKKEVTKQSVQKQKNKREQKKKRLTQKLKRIKRRLVALERQDNK